MTDAARAQKQITPAMGWCSTFNNYGPDEYQVLLQWCMDRASSRKFFYVIGREIAGTGTPHLQCAFWEPKRWRFPTAKNSAKVQEYRECDKLFQSFRQKLHNEAMKGTPVQAFEYCMKEDDYVTNATVVERQYVSVEEMDRLYGLHRSFLIAERIKARAWWRFIDNTYSHNWYLRNYDLKLGYRIPADDLAELNMSFAWCGDRVVTTTCRSLKIM